MKKIIAVLIILVLVASCSTAFAQKKACGPDCTKACCATQKKGGFFRDMQDLFTKKIPNTPKQPTHNLWDTDKQKQK